MALVRDGWTSIRRNSCAIRSAETLTTCEAIERIAAAVAGSIWSRNRDARRTARLDRDGEVVLLEDQDRSLWDREQIERGLELSREAAAGGPAGPYTVQARIAAVHAEAASAAPLAEGAPFLALGAGPMEPIHAPERHEGEG